ncbi:thiol peroxidase [candidate division KSB1 bacterium]|nr:thiol peroxidase [candidate division KSB1 bacterium]
MNTEHQQKVTLKGAPVTLLGIEAKTGNKAREFSVLDQAFKPVHLSDSAGKIRIISAVTSLDTSVCDAQTRRFNEIASSLGEAVEVITISMDLPYAQKRWCGAAGIDRVKVCSDHRDAQFGIAFGVLIKESRLLARAIFIIDREDVIRYVEYVKEITEQPDYDRALSFVKSML